MCPSLSLYPWRFMQLKLCLVLLLLCTVRARADPYRLNLTNEAAFFRSIARVESECSHDAVGDKHLRYRAHGMYQIRYPYLQDVNRVAGKDVVRVWGHKLTPQDMYDPAKARWAMRVYLHHYGLRYTRLTGQLPTASVYARIHQGGPDGWKIRRTLAYWYRVKLHYTRELYV